MMSGGLIGKYDPGMFSSYKEIQKGSKVAEFKTAQEAESFSKNRAGAELVEIKNGVYEVYNVKSSEGKAVNNQSFVDNSVSIDKSFLKQQKDSGVTRAYFITSDNFVRVLDDKTTKVSSINQEYIKFQGMATVKDKNGISTNSKDDLDINLKGKLRVSKEVFNEVATQLSKIDFPTIGKVDFSVEAKDGQYKITASKGLSVDITMKPADDGNGLACDIDAYGLGGYVGDMVKAEMAKKGFTATSTGDDDKFILKPDFKNGGLVPNLKVGNMDMNFERLDATKGNTSKFTLDPNGMSIDLDINGVGSSGTGVTAKNEQADIINANIETISRSDLSSSVKVSNGTIEAHIKETERDGVSQQIEAFGKKGVKLSGDIKVSNINTEAEMAADGKTKVSNKGSLSIESNKIDFEDANTQTRVKIEGAKGNLGYEQKNDGGFAVGLGNGEISGSFTKPDFSASVKNLKADGSLTYVPKKGNTLEKYVVQGNSVEIGDLKVKAGASEYGLGNLSLKNAHVDITPSNAGFSVESNTGTTATINGLKIGTDVNISGNLNGSISYDPQKGTTITGDTANLRGKLGNFNLDNLNARGKVTLGNDGSISLADVSKFEFDFSKTGNVSENINNLSTSGKNLVIKKEAESYSISSTKGKPAELTAFYPKTKEKEQTNIVKNLTFSGSVNLNEANGNIKIDAGTTLHAGKVGAVTFNQLKTNKDIVIDNSSDILKIDSSVSFSGEIKADNVGVKDLKFHSKTGEDNAGNISFNKKDGNISISGEASFKLDLHEEKKGNNSVKNPDEGNISFSGKIDIKKDGTKYIIESAEKSKINFNLKGVNLKDFEFQGKLIIDQGNITLQKPDGQENIILKGSVNGKEIDLKADGNVTLSSSKGETTILADKVKVFGTVAGLNVSSLDNGTSAKVTFNKDSKLPKVEGLNMGIEVEGVKFSTKNGSLDQKSDGGYVISLPSNIEAGNGKMSNLIDKVAQQFTSSPEQKTKLADLKDKLSKIDLNKVKLDDLKIELDKDFKGYSINATSSELDLDIKESEDKQISIKNTPPGKINFSLNDKGEVALSSTGTKINGVFNGVELKDLNIKGGLKYSPANGNTPEKLSLVASEKKSTSGLSGVDVDGTLVFKDSKLGKIERKLKISADADVSVTKKDKDIEIEGSNMKLDGMFSDFKVKSLPLDGKEGSFASGKVTLREDGHYDFSKLNFRLDVDGIEVYNKNGSLTSTVNKNKSGVEERTYEMKLSGDVSSKMDTLTKFLAKASNDTVMPEAVKTSTKNILDNLQNILKSGKAGVNYDLTVGLNEHFGIDNLKLGADVNIKEAKVKLDVVGMKNKNMTLDNLHVNAEGKIDKKDGDLSIKKGTIDFALNDKVKAELGNAIKETLKDKIMEQTPRFLGIKRDKIDLDVAIASDGTVSVSGRADKANIISHIDLGAKLTFDGTKINIDLDKLKTGNFIGSVVQFFYSGSRKEGVAEKVAESFQKSDISADYDGKSRISLDLQSTMSKVTEGAVKITDFKIKDNKVMINFDATYGASNDYNKPEIKKFVADFEKISNDDNDVSTEDANKFLNQIKTINSKDLSSAMERVTLSPSKLETISKASDDKDLSIVLLKKLYENKNSGRNKEHIIRIIDSLNKDNKKTLRDFISFLKTQPKTDNDIVIAVNRKVASLK